MTTSSEAFHTTRWTLVCECWGDSPEAREALADLCAAYYEPVRVYIAHTTRDLGDPRDLAQDFFANLLGKSFTNGPDRQRGRFRSYLLGAVKHFLADARDRRSAVKRGLAHEHVPLEMIPGALPSVHFEAPERSPERAFDRQWGLAILDQALNALAAEHEAEARTSHFAVLKPWLTGDVAALSQAEAARQLEMTEGALKVAIHRLRRRFRELVKAQIRQTVASEEELRDELRYLIEVVSQ